MAVVMVKRSDRVQASAAKDSALGLSRNHLFLAESMRRDVCVSWNFTDSVNLIDWIGLFRVGECNPLQYMDFKSYGVCGPQTGSVQWTLSGSDFQDRSHTYVCFRYFDGLSGVLRASTAPLLVYTTARIVVHGIQCRNFPYKNATVYAKLRCGTNSYRTNASETATWADLNFIFAIDRSRELQFTIRERSWTGDRILGEANVPIAELVMQASQETAFVLRPTNSSQPFTCHVILSVHVIPEQHDFVDAEGNVMIPENIASNTAPFDSTIFYNTNSPNTSIERPDDEASTSAMATQIISSRRNWEARVDRYGRIFYMDHRNKQTSWEPPVNDTVTSGTDLSGRHACARRTVIRGQSNGEPSAATTDDSAFPVKFLQRSDFILLLHENEQALKLYNSSRYLKHIVHRIRRDATNFDRFKQNRELVQFLNLFADETLPLPDGWQLNGDLDQQRVFVDHRGRRTTLFDPRLPVLPKRRTRSAPPNQHECDFNGNDILNVLHANANLRDVVRFRLPQVAMQLEQKLEALQRVAAVPNRRLTDDLELVTALRFLVSNSSRSDFEEHLDHFYTSLERSGYGQGPGKMRFQLRRSHLLVDAYDQILSADPSELRKSRLSVTFDEEDGLDYGGPSRELFFLLSRELFNPYYGLFEYSANDTYTVQISPMSAFVDHYVEWMELCGRVLGLALIHRCLIDTFFTRAFYKLLLGMPFSIEDLQSMDSQFYNSLLWIKENRITTDLDLTFSVNEDIAGKITEKELLPDGKNLLVTERNKQEFIALMIKWRIERGVIEQSRALLRGLHQVIDHDLLCIFDSKQLELILSGTVEIDIEDWRQNTEYKSGYYPEHICIIWFWNTVYAMNNADRLKLLQFVTGTSSIPYEGFRALRGSSGPKKFTIEKWGSEDSLPRAHTCFNRLDLPAYPTQHRLSSKLRTAIYESVTYAIE